MSQNKVDLSIVVIQDAKELGAHMSAWERLCALSLEPNVFYEPWMLLPAVEHFGATIDFRFVLIYRPTPDGSSEPPDLIGFFPLCREKTFRALPIRHLMLWQHKYCFLCTPLVHRARAHECMSAFFDWLVDEQQGSDLMLFNQIGGDGPVQQLVGDCIIEHRLRRYCADCNSRAAFHPAVDAETYIQKTLSSEYRRQMKRKEKRLAECGRMEYVTLTQDGDLEVWLKQFLQLEDSGWKGREGSALASTPASRSYFLEIGHEAYRRGKLIMQSLMLDGRPIAQYCAFAAGIGSFDFKPAYDEAYSRFSPGILLELERFRHLHTRSDLAWMDSCSEPDSFRNRIWGERKEIKSVWVSVGGWRGNLVIMVATWRNWFRNQTKSDRK
jgi:CelD/BcsL family acetyltransferase involved in cellulose biosynthesis